MPYQKSITVLLSAVLALAATPTDLSLLPQTIAQSGRRDRVGRAAIPEGYNAFVVAIGNGVASDYSEFVSTDPAEFERCQTEALQRSPRQIRAHRRDALEFFQTRFGVNAENAQDDFSLQPFVVLPQNNYRVYAIGGEVVPAKGHVLSDCGYLLTVINPEGVVLGGEFAGMHVPVGSNLVFGDYAIRKELRNGKLRTLHTVSFRASAPLIPLADGTSNFKCELISEEWGEGLAEGFLASSERDPETGNLKANQRSIWTFSDAPLNGL